MIGLAAGTGKLCSMHWIGSGARRASANLRDARRQLHRVFVYCRREDAGQRVCDSRLAQRCEGVPASSRGEPSNCLSYCSLAATKARGQSTSLGRCGRGPALRVVCHRCDLSFHHHLSTVSVRLCRYCYPAIYHHIRASHNSAEPPPSCLRSPTYTVE
jgi:hypothetical protein